MIREEAITYLKVIWNRYKAEYEIERETLDAYEMAIEALSAEAKLTVIRAKTFMRKEDFDKWAEDIKGQGENVICIPCDAEVVSADAVRINNDGTLEVKVPNATKVGRVLVMDADSHIGGGLFYPDDAVRGEWEHWGSPFSDESEVIDTIVCSVCGARFIEPKDEPKGEYNYCPNCGARMEANE